MKLIFLPGYPVFNRICKMPFMVAIFPCYLVTEKEGMKKKRKAGV